MRLDLPTPENLSLVHQMVQPVRWGDMDAFGHVNNTVYFRYMESLRVDWLQQRGWPRPAPGAGVLVVNAFCNFLQQVVFPADLLTRLYVGAIGRSSVDTYVTMALVDSPERLVATGGATVLWADRSTHKAVPLTDALKALVLAPPGAPAAAADAGQSN